VIEMMNLDEEFITYVEDTLCPRCSLDPDEPCPYRNYQECPDVISYLEETEREMEQQDEVMGEWF